MKTNVYCNGLRFHAGETVGVLPAGPSQPATVSLNPGTLARMTCHQPSSTAGQKIPIMFLSQTLNCDAAIRTILALVLFWACWGVTLSSRAQSWMLTSANTNYDWLSVASSADGSKWVATAYDDGVGDPGVVSTSTNRGKSWVQTPVATNEGWQAVACSANGSNLVAVINNQYLDGTAGPIYISTNFGKTWKQTTAATDYYISVASSADGSKLAAVDSGMGDGLIYLSANSGNSWNGTGPSGEAWASIALSSNGVKMVVADSGYGDGLIYVSTNSGSTWKATTAPAFPWTCVASSADGTHLAAVNSGFGDGLVYVSTDSGNTWNPSQSPADQWSSIAISADGTKLVAADSGSGDGLIYISSDSGATWTATGTVGFWTSVACSSDGSVLSATAYPGGVYTLPLTPALALKQTGKNALVSWQNLASATGMGLQQNSDLNSTNWIPVANLPGLTNGYYQLIVPVNLGTNCFYRLAGP